MILEKIIGARGFYDWHKLLVWKKTVSKRSCVTQPMGFYESKQDPRRKRWIGRLIVPGLPEGLSCCPRQKIDDGTKHPGFGQRRLLQWIDCCLTAREERTCQGSLLKLGEGGM